MINDSTVGIGLVMYQNVTLLLCKGEKTEPLQGKQ